MNLRATDPKTQNAKRALALTLLVASGAWAGTPATFTTPEEAGQALEAAARTHDQAALARILGEPAVEVLSSDDPAADRAAQDSLATKFRTMNRWVVMNGGSQVLHIGADNYPFPVSLAQDSSSKWYFNVPAGREEVHARKIGRNELLAIDACSAIANAEALYFEQTGRYARRIVSSPGKQDGLYWKVPEDQDSSPLGRLETFLSNPIVPAPAGKPQAFDGYAFRILTAQGDGAPGGAGSYLVDGRMTRGFAVIASPVRYGHTGITTFILSGDGVVYQKDLGERTAELAASIQAYNPAGGWTPVD